MTDLLPAPSPLGYCAPCLLGNLDTPAVTIYDRTSVCRDCLVNMHQANMQGSAESRLQAQAALNRQQGL